MKQDALLKVPTLQGLCLFCSCRLAASSSTVQRQHQRVRTSKRSVSSGVRLQRPFGVGALECGPDSLQVARAHLLAAEKAQLAVWDILFPHDRLADRNDDISAAKAVTHDQESEPRFKPGGQASKGDLKSDQASSSIQPVETLTSPEDVILSYESQSIANTASRGQGEQDVAPSELGIAIENSGIRKRAQYNLQDASKDREGLLGPRVSLFRKIPTERTPARRPLRPRISRKPSRLLIRRLLVDPPNTAAPVASLQAESNDVLKSRTAAVEPAWSDLRETGAAALPAGGDVVNTDPDNHTLTQEVDEYQAYVGQTRAFTSEPSTHSKSAVQRNRAGAAARAPSALRASSRASHPAATLGQDQRIVNTRLVVENAAGTEASKAFSPDRPEISTGVPQTLSSHSRPTESANQNTIRGANASLAFQNILRGVLAEKQALLAGRRRSSIGHRRLSTSTGFRQRTSNNQTEASSPSTERRPFNVVRQVAIGHRPPLPSKVRPSDSADYAHRSIFKRPGGSEQRAPRPTQQSESPTYDRSYNQSSFGTSERRSVDRDRFKPSGPGAFGLAESQQQKVATPNRYVPHTQSQRSDRPQQRSVPAFRNVADGQSEQQRASAATHFKFHSQSEEHDDRAASGTRRFASEIAESNELLSRLSRRFEIGNKQKDDVPGVRVSRSARDGISSTDSRAKKRPGRAEDDVGEDVRPSRRREIDEYDPAQVKRRAEKIAEVQRKHRERLAAAAQKRAKDGKPISIPAFVTVTNLAQMVGAHYSHFSKRLSTLGFDDIFASKVLDAETAALIAQEYGFNPSQESASIESAKRDIVPQPEADPADAEQWPIRPPVVTIMGHVDHGKTTILDFLRKANVVAGEAGGITQHIGAFIVKLPATGRTITFLDTPGHAAFLAMRQRGANVTDIVVLVVAADDSVMPQTLEALKHASAAQVPIIVAINKVDKPDADVFRVKQDLARHGIEIEDNGGDVQVVELSGKTGKGMDSLEEAIITQAELLDRRADVAANVDGWVVEATTKAAGRVATVLVRRGTLRPGSILVAGRTWTRVKVLRDDAGKEVAEALPGTPVEVDGWREQPVAGDRALEADDEQHAASVVDYRVELDDRVRLAEDTEAINKARREHMDTRERAAAEAVARKQGVPLDKPEESAGYVEEETGQQIIPITIKADVSGSAEAVAAYIEGIGSAMIAPKVLQSGVGAVSESDIEYASAVRGLIVAFNVEVAEHIKALAASQQVRILENNIIYRVVEDVREVLEDKLPPLITQRVLGEAEIAQVFEIGLGKGKRSKIAGCKVRNGVIGRTRRVRVMRGTEMVFDGTLSSLKNVKKSVTEMRKGSECGIGFDDWTEFQPEDIIQSYEEISERRKL